MAVDLYFDCINLSTTYKDYVYYDKKLDILVGSYNQNDLEGSFPVVQKMAKIIKICIPYCSPCICCTNQTIGYFRVIKRVYEIYKEINEQVVRELKEIVAQILNREKKIATMGETYQFCIIQKLLCTMVSNNFRYSPYSQMQNVNKEKNSNKLSECREQIKEMKTSELKKSKLQELLFNISKISGNCWQHFLETSDEEEKTTLLNRYVEIQELYQSLYSRLYILLDYISSVTDDSMKNQMGCGGKKK